MTSQGLGLGLIGLDEALSLASSSSPSLTTSESSLERVRHHLLRRRTARENSSPLITAAAQGNVQGTGVVAGHGHSPLIIQGQDGRMHEIKEEKEIKGAVNGEGKRGSESGNTNSMRSSSNVGFNPLKSAGVGTSKRSNSDGSNSFQSYHTSISSNRHSNSPPIIQTQSSTPQPLTRANSDPAQSNSPTIITPRNTSSPTTDPFTNRQTPTLTSVPRAKTADEVNAAILGKLSSKKVEPKMPGSASLNSPSLRVRKSKGSLVRSPLMVNLESRDLKQSPGEKERGKEKEEKMESIAEEVKDMETDDAKDMNTGKTKDIKKGKAMKNKKQKSKSLGQPTSFNLIDIVSPDDPEIDYGIPIDTRLGELLEIVYRTQSEQFYEAGTKSSLTYFDPVQRSVSECVLPSQMQSMRDMITPLRIRKVTAPTTVSVPEQHQEHQHVDGGAVMGGSFVTPLRLVKEDSVEFAPTPEVARRLFSSQTPVPVPASSSSPPLEDSKDIVVVVAETETETKQTTPTVVLESFPIGTSGKKHRSQSGPLPSIPHSLSPIFSDPATPHPKQPLPASPYLAYSHKIILLPNSAGPHIKKRSAKEISPEKRDNQIYFTQDEQVAIQQLVDEKEYTCAKHRNCTDCRDLEFAFQEIKALPTSMAPEDRQTIIANNRSLRNIKNELENLISKGAIDDSAYDSIIRLLPDETSFNGRSTASPAPPSNAFSALRVDPSPPPPAYSNSSNAPPTLPSRSPAPPPPGKPIIGSAIALYRYNDPSPGGLSFEPHDQISIYVYSNADWWEGKNNRTNSEGVFPANYVQIEMQQSKIATPPNNNAAVFPNNEKQGHGYGGHYQPHQPQQQQGYPGANNGGMMPPPPQQSNPYNSAVPPMQIAEQPTESKPGKGAEMGKKFGKKLGNAAIFGAGATIGGNIVNSIF